MRLLKISLATSLLVIVSACGSAEKAEVSPADEVNDGETEAAPTASTTQPDKASPSAPVDETGDAEKESSSTSSELSPEIIDGFVDVLSGNERLAQEALNNYSGIGRKKATALAGTSIFYSEDDLDLPCDSVDNGGERALAMSSNCEDSVYKRQYNDIEGAPGAVSNFSHEYGEWDSESQEWMLWEAKFYEVYLGFEGQEVPPPYNFLAAAARSVQAAAVIDGTFFIDGVYAWDWGAGSTGCIVTFDVRSANPENDFKFKRFSGWTYYDFIGGEISTEYGGTEDVLVRGGMNRIVPVVLEAPCEEWFEFNTDFLGLTEVNGESMFGVVEEVQMTVELVEL